VSGELVIRGGLATGGDGRPRVTQPADVEHEAPWSQDVQAVRVAADLDRPSSPTRRKVGLILADSVAIVVGAAATFAIQAIVKPVPELLVTHHLLLAFAVVPGFAMGAWCNRLYQARANERWGEEVRHVANAVAAAIATVLLVGFATQFKELSRLWVVLLAATISCSLLIERRIARHVFARLRATGRSVRRILIVGTDAHAIGLMNAYERNPHLGYRVIGMVGPDENAARGSVGVLGTYDELDRILDRTQTSGVVMSLGSVSSDTVNAMTRRLTDAGYHVALSSLLNDIDVTRLRPQSFDGLTMIYVEPVARGGWRTAAKRAFDIVLAATILTLTAPLLLLSVIAIAIDSRGPAFFRQERVGRDGRRFQLVKLRSMVVGAEQQKESLRDLNEVDGPLFKMANDPRVTRVGRVLRKLSIDELPQLVCVLRGTMSIVGPRPALPDEAAQWDEQTRERLRVKPGLTGLWQVSGRSDSSFDQYRRLDLRYVDNWSLMHDIRICCRTALVVLLGRGAA
jgi:exopolysaccharide biosynthesis polyprenyl glycosylphosphotransferase